MFSFTRQLLFAVLLAHFVICDETVISSVNLLTTFGTSDRLLDEKWAESVAFDKDSNRLFVANGGAPRIDVFDLTNVFSPIISSIDISIYGASVSTVASYNGLIAASIVAEDTVSPGKVVFIRADGPTIISSVTVGSLPDDIKISPKGNMVLTANEGEPNADYTIDPEGTISVIRLEVDGKKVKFTVENLEDSSATFDIETIGFSDFNSASKRDSSTRFFGSLVPSNPTFAQDAEPEYISISPDEKTAWVTLQENNAIAEIDLEKFKVESVTGLGFKNHSASDNHIDANDENGISIGAYPVWGNFQPDQIAYFIGSDDREYLLVANEGDDRKFEGTPGFLEMVKLSSVSLDTSIFDVSIQDTYGNLRISVLDSDNNNDGLVDKLRVSGGRSFSIYDINRKKFVYDSGDDLEQLFAAQSDASISFNADGAENQSFDTTSVKRGSEPAGAATFIIDGITYGVVAFDKQSGFGIYNISRTPSKAPELVSYFNNRDFSVTFDSTNFKTFPHLDLNPSGLLFLGEDAQDFYETENDLGYTPLLVVSNSGSGTISVYELVTKNID